MTSDEMMTEIMTNQIALQIAEILDNSERRALETYREIDRDTGKCKLPPGCPYVRDCCEGELCFLVERI